MQLTTEHFEELNCRLEVIEAQRNRALTDHAIAEGRLKVSRQNLAGANARVAELEQKKKDLEDQVAELTKPKEA